MYIPIVHVQYITVHVQMYSTLQYITVLVNVQYMYSICTVLHYMYSTIVYKMYRLQSDNVFGIHDNY